MLNAFLYGVMLALGLIIPLGVQNIFIFNQGATQRRYRHALPSVLTASICDTILILGAVLGISVVILTIPWLKSAIFIVGSIFLLYMGWVVWHSHSRAQKDVKPLPAKYQISFALSVSLLNPHALMDTIAVIGSNSMIFSGQEKWAFTLACILVSFSWFFSLSFAGHFLNKLDTSQKSLTFINKLSALIMWAIALSLVWQL